MFSNFMPSWTAGTAAAAHSASASVCNIYLPTHEEVCQRECEREPVIGAGCKRDVECRV